MTTIPFPTTVDPEVLKDLLLRCARQDEEAFAEYYRLTSPLLNAITMRRIRSRRTVETALVGIYVTIWHRAATFLDGGESAWEWTLTILDQALQDQRRG